MKPAPEVAALLASPKKIFITTHHKPDGDAIGSTTALSLYLKKKGHQTCVVIPSELPDFLQWMPDAGALVNFESDASKTALEALRAADLIFCLDFNQYDRTKQLAPFLEQATQPKVLIDHHLFPAAVWDYGTSEPEKSSTCEMVYDFINAMGDNALIDAQIGAALYTGVMTDTGSFRFSVTTASVHRMIADLMDKGLKHAPVHEAVYDNWSANRMKFVGYMLIERMELFPKWNAGLIAISKKDLQLFHLGTGDTEGLVNYPMSVSGIRFATLITERSDGVRLSFRSKGDFNVNEFAREHFAGGGHFNASGGRSALGFEETISRFKQILSDIHPR